MDDSKQMSQINHIPYGNIKKSGIFKIGFITDGIGEINIITRFKIK